MKAMLVEELIELIGEAGLVRLAEAFGGTRLFIPERLRSDHEIVGAVGMEAACALAERLVGDVIRVPLAREQRAAHYRANGASNSQIAVRLGMTENGVEKLLRRLRERG